MWLLPSHEVENGLALQGEVPGLDTESCTLEVTAIIKERASQQVRQVSFSTLLQGHSQQKATAN